MLRKITVFMTIALLLFLLITLIYPYIRFVIFHSSTLSDNTVKPQIIGHRGAAGIFPENTLVGFKKSIEFSDIIELDVHLTRDNVVVVMHDSDVERTTNGVGEIIDLDYDYIKKLDAGLWFDKKYKGEKVPTLDEVLALIDSKKTVLIELKWPKKGVYKNLVPKVIDVIKSQKATEWVQLQSFEYSYLTEAIEIAPEIRCNQLIFGYSNFPPINFDRSLHFGKHKIIKGVKGINIFFPYLSSSFVKKMKNENLEVSTFTINDPKYFNRATSLGVNAVITDYPNRFN